MAATKIDVDRWIQYAKDEGYEYIISVCDTFDYDDYPAYFKNKEEAVKAILVYDGMNMQKINEFIHIRPDGTVHHSFSIK